jgi:hypothetical protein
MSVYGIRVLRSDKIPIDIGQEEKDYSVDSTKNTLKIFLEEVVEVTLNAANSYKYDRSIAHNLGYAPIFKFAIKWVDTDWRDAWINFGVENFEYVRHYDKNTLNITIYRYTPDLLDCNQTETLTYKIMILVDPTQEAWS